jgi:hypothetical protein
MIASESPGFESVLGIGRSALYNSYLFVKRLKYFSDMMQMSNMKVPTIYVASRIADPLNFHEKSAEKKI